MSFVKFFMHKEPTKLGASDVEEFIGKRIEENLNLEYKDARIIDNIDKLAESVCAFANTEGGLLILGVGEDKILAGNRVMRIFPSSIAWTENAIAREQLEEKLGTQIEPPVPLRIFPIRKSKDGSEAIFLLDIPKSNELHMHKGTRYFYKRLNFEKLPMGRDEIIQFIKYRVDFEKCVWFRFHVDEVLKAFMDGMLVRLDPDYAKLRPLSPQQIVTRFRSFTKSPFESVIETVRNVEIMNLERFHMELSDFAEDIDKVGTYPHDRISPEESVLFDQVKEGANQQAQFKLREFIQEEAEYHEVEEGTKLSCIGFAEATKDERHFLHYLSGYMGSLISLSELILKLSDILDQLQTNYGEFGASRVVRIVYDWIRSDKDPAL
jgi:hypothetical protein